MCRKFAMKVTWEALTAKKHASEEVLEIKKFKAFMDGILENKLQAQDDEKAEKEISAKMANMQVEK